VWLRTGSRTSTPKGSPNSNRRVVGDMSHQRIPCCESENPRCLAIARIDRLRYLTHELHVGCTWSSNRRRPQLKDLCQTSNLTITGYQFFCVTSATIFVDVTCSNTAIRVGRHSNSHSHYHCHCYFHHTTAITTAITTTTVTGTTLIETTGNSTANPAPHGGLSRHSNRRR
jgi:hypothetical protein